MLLYAYAIEQLTTSAPSSSVAPLEPDALYEAMRHITFEGISGAVTLDGAADRVGKFDILNAKLLFGFERFSSGDRSGDRSGRRLDVELPAGDISLDLIGSYDAVTGVMSIDAQAVLFPGR